MDTSPRAGNHVYMVLVDSRVGYPVQFYVESNRLLLKACFCAHRYNQNLVV